MLGAFGGLQLGLWKLRSDYFGMDPNGDRLREMRAIMKEISSAGSHSGPTCPKTILSQPNGRQEAESVRPRTNQYGDPIEQESSLK